MSMWTQLPPELLSLIASHLPTQTDLLRFRSVCSAWRSSIHHYPRHHFPILPNDGISQSSWGFSLSVRTLFLLSLPSASIATDPWLVKVTQPSSRRFSLLNPLSRCRLPLPTNFPTVLDLMDIRVVELGREYVLQYMNYCLPGNGRGIGDAGNLYMEKVVFLRLDDVTEFVLLTIHVSGKLAMFRTGARRWSIIQEMPSPYDDVILYKGEFYAVDGTGRCVVVGLDMRLNMVAESVFGGDKKYLVESLGELLLVDMYLSIDVDDDNYHDEGEIGELGEHFDYVIAERTVRFRVYRLEWESESWAEVRDLRDRVLFLGDDSTFSASTEDLGVCKGNCIFFADNFCEDDGRLKEHGDVGFYDIDTGSIGPLENYEGYSQLLWPPPEWITCENFKVQNQLASMTL